MTTHQCFDGSCLVCDTSAVDANGCRINEVVLDDCRCAAGFCGDGGEGGGGGGVTGEAPAVCSTTPAEGCASTGCQECGGQCFQLCSAGFLDPATCTCTIA